MGRFSIAIALFASLFSVAALSARADGWPTTNFDAFPGNPVSKSEFLPEGADPLEYEFENSWAPSERSLELIESAMKRIAIWYREKGFPPPAIETIVDTDNGPAYRVYVCSREIDSAIGEFFGGTVLEPPWDNCNHTGAYSRLCNNPDTRTRYFYVNEEKSLDDDGNLTELGLQTMAHEMFHAIYAAMPAGQSDPACDIRSNWLTEGLADAIGYDIIQEVFAGEYTENPSDDGLAKRRGYRPYLYHLTQHKDAELPIPNASPSVPHSDGAYRASSFWRYLADAAPAGWRMLNTPETAPPFGLLDIRFPGGTGWRREVQWLDTGLKGQFNRSLAQMYARFANDWALRVVPFSRYNTQSAKDALDHSVMRTFGECVDVTLSPAQPNATVRIEIDRLAGRCLWLNSVGVPGLVQISFQTESEELGDIKDIWIGQAGTMLLARGELVGEFPSTPRRYIGAWKDFSLDGSQKALFILTNGAVPAKESTKRTITLTVSMPDNQVDSRFVGPIQSLSTFVGPMPPNGVVPPPKQPTYSHRANRLGKDLADTVARTARQMEIDKGALIPNVSHAVDTSRRTSVRPCTNPFLYQVCGPHMTVTLQVVPGTYGAPPTVTAEGGLTAQVFGGFQAMAASSMGDQTPVWREIQARIREIDASRVGIQFPLIDYGFSGTFDNASISVDMSGGRIWRAIAPPDETGRSRLVGSVTIDEYTPQYLRGRFSAPLAEFVEDPGGGPAQYQRRETITGRFNSVAPWLNDERLERVQVATLQEVAEDVANSLGLSPTTVQTLRDQGVIPGSGNPAESSGTGHTVGTPVECTCECAIKHVADELCQLLCEDEFAACP